MLLMFNVVVLIFLSFYVIISNSNAKVIYFPEISKQFITFLIENLTIYNFLAILLLNFVRNEQFLAIRTATDHLQPMEVV